jgi:uncharacterized protein
VARTAVDEGHEVQVFIAGDGVQLVRAETAAAAQGIGTGSVAEHLESLRSAGVPILLSGMSSKARGIEARQGYELAPPQKLVELAVWSDTALTY